MKGTSVHIKDTRIKKLLNYQASDFAMSFRVPKTFRDLRETDARFSKLSVIAGLVKLFRFPFQMGVSEGLNIVQ